MATDIYVNQDNYVDGDTKPSDAFLGQRLKATNGKVWEWTGTTWVLIVDVSSDGSNVVTVSIKDKTVLDAGERQTSSETLSYISVKEDWNYTVVDYASDPVTVSSAPAILGAIFANTQLAGDTCAIKDDTATVFTLPIAIPTTGSGYDTMKGTRFSTSLIFDFGASASAGNYTVLWRLI